MHLIFLYSIGISLLIIGNLWSMLKGYNIKIIRQLNESGIEFAFPTQMLHLDDLYNKSGDQNDDEMKKNRINN